MIALLRSVVAVIVGYAVFAIPGYLIFRLTGHAPHEAPSVQFLLVTLTSGIFFALVGGYVSGWVAGRHPLAHAVAMATLIVIGAGTSLAMTIGHGSVWSQVAAITLMAPAAVLGGWWRPT